MALASPISTGTSAEGWALPTHRESSFRGHTTELESGRSDMTASAVKKNLFDMGGEVR
jgi:hypothetical protein